MKKVAILGSTGSIGRSALEIVARFPDRFQVGALSAKRNVDLLCRQIRDFKPEVAAVYEERDALALQGMLPAGTRTEILFGGEGYRAAATLDSVEIVLTAMVGAAGLFPTLDAIDGGKNIALANKETLVMAGDIVMERAKAKGGCIYPVDSEHSAIYQCLNGQRQEEVAKVVLTASGGPFWQRPAADFRDLTPADALKHPTWRMGPKITIDSATLMNKGLEVIEAKHLFGLLPDQIEVVIHPQSIVHSMVAYLDGSIMAQMGLPDMKGAIAYALSYPERLPLDQGFPDFASLGALTFATPDFDKFPCLKLAFQALGSGGTLPAVMNAANETAVEAFLQGKIRFTDIPSVVARAMDAHSVDDSPSLEGIVAADRWARRKAQGVVRAVAG